MKLVEKDALVAEIERRIKQFVNENNTLLKNSDNAKELCSRIIMCKEVLSLLDTLEVKEVDLEKELIQWHKNHFERNGTFIGMNGFYLENASQIDIARHFFELGLKAQKGEEV